MRLPLAVLALIGFAASASAQEIPRAPAEHSDTWSDPAPGVRYLHRTTTVPSSIHALVVDLGHPGVAIRTTPYDERWRTVTEYATENQLAAAVNGGFWGMMQRAEGIAAGGGARWPDGNDDEVVGFFAVTRSGRAWISPPERNDDAVPAERLAQAVSGRPMLVRAGAVDTVALDAFEPSNLRHPRSAVGVSRDGKKVVLLVADGRQGFSRGMTLYEVARLLRELGAWDAINLDGGGSSAMFLATEGGVVNAPSGGRWEARLGFGAEGPEGQRPSKVRVRDDGSEEVFVRGHEREVMNHIGVVAPEPGTATATAPGEPGRAARPHTRVVVERPRPPSIRLGAAREYLFPLMYAGAVLAPLAVIALWLWRRRRRALRAAA